MLFVKGMVNFNSAQGKEQRKDRPAEPGQVRDSGQRRHRLIHCRSPRTADAVWLLANGRL
jgi:hypothetical protein